MENEVIDVYCHMTMSMTSNGQCSDGGWTLVMKIDGNKVAGPHYLCLWLPFLMKRTCLQFPGFFLVSLDFHFHIN